MGVKLRKYPTDLFLYQMLIYKLRPDFIVETGAYLGGASLFFAHMCDLVGNGRVIGIDKRDIQKAQHPRITYYTGSTVDDETLRWLHALVKGSCMVILDSDHHTDHVTKELNLYSPLVTQGQYLVCEDTYLNNPVPWVVTNRKGEKFVTTDPGPKDAVEKFIKDNKDFVIDNVEYPLGMSPNGWLRRL